MPTTIRKEGRKLKLHRSHMSGKRMTQRINGDCADRLAKQTKKLAKAIKYGQEKTE